MADPKKMSLEEILAACRKADGEGSSQDETPTPAAESTPEPSASSESSPPAPAAESPAASGEKLASADARKLSVAEMMAAARAEKAKKEAAAPAAPKEEPAAAGGGAKLSSGEARKMSVAEMMAAARGEKKKSAPAPAAKKAPASKPAPAAAKKAAAPAKTGPLDTASILASARSDGKRGPMSKAEAAAKGQPVPTKPAIVAPPMPQRPEYARPREPQPVADGDTRRGFMAAIAGVFFGSSLAVGFTTLTLTHVLWLLGLARFMFPNILTEPPTKFKVGFPGDLAPGQVETKYKAQYGVWIVRGNYEGRDMIYALKSVCTHLGCTPNWLEGEQKFKCPCHGSGFYKDGINFEGPAPRPLERYSIRVGDDGQLEVDKSQTFNEEKGEWKDSASYVA